MTSKAIETIYKGYRMRSRLEARWAVFFDTLGIEYRYEHEGYDLDGTWYLPDFYLPHYNITTDDWLVIDTSSHSPIIWYADINVSWTPVYWTICDACQRLDLTGAHLPACCDKKSLRLDSPRILEAYTAARSARFEHGENG